MTLAESEDVVVAETRLTLNLGSGDGATSLSVYAYLHRTLSAARADEVEGATVRLSSASGAVVHLEPTDNGDVCLRDDPDDPNEDVGSCYRAVVSPSPFAPREVVELEVVLADGGTITGSSRIPDAFHFVGLTHEDGHCRLEPDTNYRFKWTEAAGTWSYLSDTWIEGLPEALAGRDIEVPDSLYLTGFGIGEEDTDVLFPGNTGYSTWGTMPTPICSAFSTTASRAAPGGRSLSPRPTETTSTGSGAETSTPPESSGFPPSSGTGPASSARRRSVCST